MIEEFKRMNTDKYVSKLSSDGMTLAKIIATVSVVFTHSYKLFGYMSVEDADVFYLRGIHAFAACGVPVFFLLSGYFLVFKDNWDYGKNLKKKFKSLVIPYLVFILVYAVISCAGSLVLPNFFDDFRKFTVYDWIMRLFGIPFVIAPRFYGPLWFVRELLIFNLLSFALVPLVKKTPGYILLPAMVGLYFLPIDQIIRYSVSFFIIGMYFGFRKRLPVFNSWIHIIILFIVGFVVPSFVGKGGGLVWKVSVFLMTVFILSISGKLAQDDGAVKMAKTIIPYSFPIYLLHEYPMTTIMRLLALKHISLPVATIAFFIAPILVICMCVVVIEIWKRVLPGFYSLSTGGR